MANENKYMRYFTNDTNDLVIPRDYENAKAEIATITIETIITALFIFAPKLINLLLVLQIYLLYVY